jgi:phosphomethylpyrimidine synthase
MSARAELFLSKTARVDEAAIRPFPNSRKIYVPGSRPDIRVPMREIAQTATPAGAGMEHNAPVTVYDTSGPYTDPEVRIDIRHGLPDVRGPWIAERGDTEILPDLTSEFGRRRAADPLLDRLRFSGHQRRPRRAQGGCSVTQMHYARRGIITPEMEYVAIRER